jgi:carbon-monoxide dehydrogenase large subunit
MPTQGLTPMRDGLAGGTGIAPEKLRIHAHDVGGGFGIRSDAYSEYCALMLAAKKVGRPVKWVSTRSETFLSDHHGRAAKLQGELALDTQGRFLGIRFLWIVNSGAYLSQPGPIINTLPTALHAPNLYRIPAIYGLHLLVLTNTTPTTAYRGAARPNVSYLVERLVEEAAAEMRIDRIELRRRNLIPKEAFPYKTLFNAQYDSGDPAGLVDEALARADWQGFAARREAAKARGKLRGIACCLYVEPSGGGASPVEEAAIKFGASGNPLLYSLAGPSGQGHETVFPEVVGEILGLDPLTIEHRASDPDGPILRGEGSIGSRSLMSHGGALVATAREVIRKGRDLAALRLEVASDDLEFSAGFFRVRGTDVAIGLAELARLHAGSGAHPLDSCEAIPGPRAFPSGAHVAEVEIDAATGAIEVAAYVAVDDCGRIINQTLVEGQIHGGIVQGLGQVLMERCVYGADGQPVTGSFMDYAMPRAEDVGELRLHDRGIPSPNNVLGVKGVGEAGTTGAVPTLACAVIDALRPLGISRLDLPYTPARIWAAIKAAS